MRSVGSMCGLALLWLGAVPCAAMAETATTSIASPDHPAAAVEQGVPATQATNQVAGLGKRVDSTTLSRLSGGTDVTERMTLNGTVSDNHTDHVVTGANVISADSFSGATGVPMVIQNTGNSVLIQNATIINVQFQP